MDILNNIWTAVSTPNEVLTNIIVIILGILENYLIMYLFLTVLKVIPNKKQKIMYAPLISALSVITLYTIPSPFNVFVNYFVMIVLIHFIFKISLLKSILATVFSSIIFGLIGFLILNPYLSFLNLTSEQLSIIPIYRIGYLISMYSILLIIILILKIKNVHISSLDEIDKKNTYIVSLNMILGIFTLNVQTLITFYYLDKLPLVVNFLSFISLLAYFIINVYSLTRILKLIKTRKLLESAEAYNNTLQILHDNVRGFKHDFDNMVTIIGGYVKTNDMKGLKKYYSQLEDDCQKVNNLYVLNPSVVNNDGVYNLLTKKYHEAESKGIKVNISFLLDLSTLNMKIYEFSRILGILLDNAIEASSDSNEKIINITFRNDTKNSRQIICIENSYSNKDIDTEKIFEKGVTEKDNHNGLGLWEIRKIISKNNQVNLFTSKTDELFSQQLEIYY